MPYSIGEQGSYGCSGYPVVKDGTSDVMGCHDTREAAGRQIAAIKANENKGIGIKQPEEWQKVNKALPDAYRPASSEGVPPGQNCANCIFYDKSKVMNGLAYCTKWDDYVKADYYCKAWAPKEEVSKASPCWDGYVQRGMKEKDGRMVPNCVPVSKAIKDDMYRKFKVKRRRPRYVSDSTGAIVAGSDSMTTKSAISEGDFVMGRTTEGIIHGVVEHIMVEGGTLGTPGSEYALVSMPPDNPAMSVRIYEEDDEDGWEPTAYSIGMMYQDAEVVDAEEHTMEMMTKAEGYAPTSGMRAAARRALKWKEDGKATGAGTPVGWGRATDIVAGRSMSLSVVKRMYSFFSRHEVDKKGKGFFSGPEFPSNGRIMWDAWGGDAGFSWSRAIVRREMDKALFANFGKDFTTSTGADLFSKAKSISVGDHVTFGVPKPPAPTENAHGEVERIERSGTVTIGNEKVEATSENPVAVVRVWAKQEGGGYSKTDRRVAKPFSSLSVASGELKEASMTDMDIEKVSESRLRELAEAYNKGKEGNKRITVGALKQVYNRGIGAYRTNPGSVRGTVSSAEQWAMGRVNAFMAGLRGNFPRTAFDLDLFPKGHPRHSDKKTETKKSEFESFGKDFSVPQRITHLFKNTN